MDQSGWGRRMQMSVGRPMGVLRGGVGLLMGTLLCGLPRVGAGDFFPDGFLPSGYTTPEAACQRTFQGHEGYIEYLRPNAWDQCGPLRYSCKTLWTDRPPSNRPSWWTINRIDHCDPEQYRQRGKNLGAAGCRHSAGTPTVSPLVGNPIHIGTGNKFHREPIYSGTLLRWGLYYNSRATEADSLGPKWRHSFSAKVVAYRDPASGVETAIVHRPDGGYYVYHEQEGLWVADPDVNDSLTRAQDVDDSTLGWAYRRADDVAEGYDAQGRLISLTDPGGRTTTLSYSGHFLARVAAEDGEALSLEYTASSLSAVSDQTGRRWAFAYAASHNLAAVIDPDATPWDESDNPRRQYHYEDARFPNHLTGISDRRGIRYASYAYDERGRAISSSHADHADRVDIVYHPDGSRTVTNGRGAQSTYTTVVRAGTSLVTGVSGPGCPGCGSGDTVYTYDARNHLSARTEHGLTTRYGDYDAQGQYGYRIEAAGTPEARRLTFTYDPRFHGRLTSITEPSVYPGHSRRTTYRYDALGNRLSEEVSGYDPQGTPGLAHDALCV